MKALLTLAILLGLSTAHAAKSIDLKKDFDSLGGNEALRERARNLDPKNRVRVVQNRVVDRNFRLEIGGNFGMVAGGDAYVKTQSWGGNLDFHITPKWSLGVRYARHMNSLTNEGQAYYDNARMQQSLQRDYEIPELDYAIDTGLAVVNWYPFYGKMSLSDTSVVHFDVYLLAGYGQTRLESGSSPTLAAGGGLGMWLGQHFATRFEGRYQGYEDRPNGVARKIDTAVVNLSIGLLL